MLELVLRPIIAYVVPGVTSWVKTIFVQYFRQKKKIIKRITFNKYNVKE
jgi:hypothetical protein